MRVLNRLFERLVSTVSTVASAVSDISVEDIRGNRRDGRVIMMRTIVLAALRRSVYTRVNGTRLQIAVCFGRKPKGDGWRPIAYERLETLFRKDYSTLVLMSRNAHRHESHVARTVAAMRRYCPRQMLDVPYEPGIRTERRQRDRRALALQAATDMRIDFGAHAGRTIGDLARTEQGLAFLRYCVAEEAGPCSFRQAARQVLETMEGECDDFERGVCAANNAACGD